MGTGSVHGGATHAREDDESVVPSQPYSEGAVVGGCAVAPTSGGVNALVHRGGAARGAVGQAHPGCCGSDAIVHIGAGPTVPVQLLMPMPIMRGRTGMVENNHTRERSRSPLGVVYPLGEYGDDYNIHHYVRGTSLPQAQQKCISGIIMQARDVQGYKLHRDVL